MSEESKIDSKFAGFGDESGYENNYEYQGGALLKKKNVNKKVEFADEKKGMEKVDNGAVMNEIEESEIRMKKNSILIQLGDVVKFMAPSNEQLHQRSFLVVFCNKDKIKMVDVENGFQKVISMTSGVLDASEKIDSVVILFREEYPGYALQNDLIPGTWIQIHFGGDWVYSVTGKITNLEEDRIEIHAWKEDVVFYLDFAYNGLPETPPFVENIEILDKPPSEAADADYEEVVDVGVADVGREGDSEKGREGDSEWSYEEKEEESEEAEANILEELRNEYVQADGIAKDWVPEIDIEIGELLVAVNQRLEVSEKHKRYSLAAQKSDLMDELLSRIPNYQRTPVVMKEIEHSIQRFEELHQMYSLIGENGGVVGNRPLNSKFYKPLVKSLSNFDKSVRWVLPVTSVRKRFWFDILEKNNSKKKPLIGGGGDENDSDEDGASGINNDENGYFVKKEDGYDDGSGYNEAILNPQMTYYYDMTQTIDRWKNGRIVGYKNLLKDLDVVMRPIVDVDLERGISRGMGRGLGHGVTVMEDMETVLDNRPEDFDVLSNQTTDAGAFTSATLFSNNEKDTTENDIQVIRRPFVIQKFVDSISLLKMNVEKTGKKTIEKEMAIPNEKMFLKSFLFLPEEWMIHSRVFCVGANIGVKTNYGLFWPQKSRILNARVDVDSVVIKDLTREYVHGESSDACLRKDMRGKELGKEGIRFLSKVQHFDLAKEGVKKVSGKIENPLVSFLNTVIPNTCYLIDLMSGSFEKDHWGNLTILEFMRMLEPFGLYLSEIGFQDVNHIQKIIRKRIVELRTKLADGRKMFNELEIYLKREREKYSNPINVETVFKFFKGKGDVFLTMFMEQYGLNVEYIGSSEALSRIYDLDSGTLFANLLSFLSFSLLTPNSVLRGGVGGVVGGGYGGRLDEGFQQFYHGGNRYLSKRYSSLKEMMDDNHRTDVHWDKVLDKLPYHLAHEYANAVGGEDVRGGSENIIVNVEGEKVVSVGGAVSEDGDSSVGGGAKSMRQKMSATEFMEYLAMNLTERHFCPQKEALEMASMLISGKRPVRNGEYASVVMGGGNEIGYYKREHHNWVRDHSIDFGVDENETKVFSNLSGGGLGFASIGGNGNGNGNGKTAFQGKEIVSMSANPYKKMEILKSAIEQEEIQNGGDEEKKQARRVEKELLQRKMQENLETMAASIQQMTEKQFVIAQRMKSLKKTALYRYDYVAHALGVLAASAMNAREIVVSPYMGLRDLILEQTDFIKKQQNIVSFYHEFCREPIPGMEGEIKHWKYCVASNARLLPSWIYQLALEFCQGGDYSGLLERLCVVIGTSSEDGEAVVDKYSGLVMKKIENSIDEGVDENGFKKITRAVMGDAAEEVGSGAGDNGDGEEDGEGKENEMDEEDDEELAERIDKILVDGTSSGVGMKKSLKLDRVYENENTEQMAKVCKHYLQSMRIKELEIQENVLDFVIAMVSELMNDKTFMDDEARFVKKVKMSQKAGKQVANVSYKQYSQQLLVYATICLTLIGLQTFQGLVNAKTFSNCIPSLKGYPAGEGGRDVTSGLKFMACILVQVRIEEEPWNAIPIRNKEDFHMTKMTGMIDEKIIRRPLVVERMEQKRIWLEGVRKMGMEIDESLDLGGNEKWSQFRPPLLADLVLDGRETQMVTPDFIREWKEEMQTTLKTSDYGRKGQKMGVIRTKLLALGMGVFSRINRVVDLDETNFLMKTANGVAYLENGCCSSNVGLPLKYFSEKEPEIVGFVKSCRALENLLEWADARKRTVLLFHNSPTRFVSGMENGLMVGKTWATYYKENIYSAIVHYFHYNRPTPVPEYLRPVYEEAPKKFPKHVSEKEQREWLEKEGRNYDVAKLQECMTLVNRHNILPGSLSSSVMTLDFGEKGVAQNLMDFIVDAEFELGRGIRAGEGDLGDLYGLLKEVIQKWTPGTMNEDMMDEKLLTLNLYLAEKNDAMIRKIRELLRPKNEPENARLQFLEKIQDWNLTKNLDNGEMGLGLSNSDTLHQVTMFIRNMCEVIFSYSEETFVPGEINTPKHWGFDLKHYQLLKNFIQKGMGEFPGLSDESGMGVLPFFLEFVSRKHGAMFGQIRRLLALFPVFTPLVFRNNGDVADASDLEFYALFPKETCYGVYVFCLYFLMQTHLESLKDPEIMRVDKKNKRQDALVRQAVEEDEFDDDLMVTRRPVLSLESDERDSSGYENNMLNVMDKSRYNDMESKVRSFFYAFLDVEMEKKGVADKTYDQLKREQEKTQEREKTRITDRLKKMSIYERNVERTMKTFKLGQWGVGQDKGLYKYDKATFVREIDEQLGISEDDVIGQRDAVMDSENLVDMNPDRMTDGLDLMQGELDEEMEQNMDIMGMSEDWFDGEYGYDADV